MSITRYRSLESWLIFSFHTRHHRNYSTVLSTQSRIFWFTVLEAVVIVGMSFVQIWILKTFFSKGSGR